MSHSHGEVIHQDKVVGHFEYNGTCDVAIGQIYDTKEEVDENWRSGRQGKCTCGKPSVDVILYSNYGNGFYWQAKACLECKTIVDGKDPYYEVWGNSAGYGYSYPDLIGPERGHPLR